MANNICCVPYCSNKGGHVLPKNAVLRKKWLNAIKRQNWNPNLHSIVCKSHFKNDDYVTASARGGKPIYKRLNKMAVPSIFVWTKNKKEVNSKSSFIAANLNEVECSTHEKTYMHSAFKPTCRSVGVWVAMDTEYIRACKSTASQTNQLCTFSVEMFTNDNEGMHFYTGLESYQKFLFVFQSLGEASNSLNYIYGNVSLHINTLNQFFITMIILRQRKPYFELSKLFSTTKKCISNIFITWIKFMSAQWKEIPLWTSTASVRFYAPADFSSTFPTTKVIIDGTECPIRRSSLPKTQQCTYSAYKNKNTVKVLIGSTPGGLKTYISPTYGGSTSDRQIIERSQLMQLCEPGDSIMADKGFNIQDIFAPYGVKINIPAFFRKSNRILASTIKTYRDIARKRVHIERQIGLIKTFKILKLPLNETEVILSEDILFVCTMLCNFRNNIMGRDT